MRQENVNAAVNKIKTVQAIQLSILEAMRKESQPVEVSQKITFFGVPENELTRLCSKHGFEIARTKAGSFSFFRHLETEIRLTTINLPFKNGIVAKCGKHLFPVEDLEHETGLKYQ